MAYDALVQARLANNGRNVRGSWAPIIEAGGEAEHFSKGGALDAARVEGAGKKLIASGAVTLTGPGYLTPGPAPEGATHRADELPAAGQRSRSRGAEATPAGAAAGGEDEPAPERATSAGGGRRRTAAKKAPVKKAPPTRKAAAKKAPAVSSAAATTATTAETAAPADTTAPAPAAAAKKRATRKAVAKKAVAKKAPGRTGRRAAADAAPAPEEPTTGAPALVPDAAVQQPAAPAADNGTAGAGAAEAAEGTEGPLTHALRGFHERLTGGLRDLDALAGRIVDDVAEYERRASGLRGLADEFPEHLRELVGRLQPGKADAAQR